MSAPAAPAKPAAPTPTIVCGLCRHRRHDLCPRGVYNPKTNRVIPCACSIETAHPEPKCRICGDRGELDALMVCVDSAACALRAEDKKTHSSLGEQLTEIKAEAAARRQVKPRTPRGEGKPSTGKCLCCDEPTKGGLFLPGHDARLVSTLARDVKAGTTTPEDARAVLSRASDALRAKLEKRLAP